METAKLGFFTKIKKAIFNFEEYTKFIAESTKKAISYFIKILLIFSLIVTCALVYQMNIEVDKAIKVVKEEFPEFSITNNELQMQDGKDFNYYFEDLNFQVIMSEALETEEINNYENCLILLKNKMTLKYSGYVAEVTYKNAQINNTSTKEIVEFIETQNWKMAYGTIGLAIFIISFIVYSIIFLLDIITLSLLGLISGMLIRTVFKFKDMLKISIYAMTLPIILYLLYIISNILFGITIKYFQIAYNAISYIYIITVLLMIKSDIIKNTQELQKILEEQKKVKEELEKEKQEEQEDKKKEKPKEKEKKPKEDEKEKDTGAEPQVEN